MKENITKEEVMKLNEEDLMFITIPGRMGDIYGSTLVIRKDNKYIFYRIDNLFKNLDIIDKVFPIWSKSLKDFKKKYESDRYNYIYMGMGNGLCINKEIYYKFIPYLIKNAHKSNLYHGEKNLEYQSAINYEMWEKALNDMINN